MSPTLPRIVEAKLNPPALVAAQVERPSLSDEIARAAVKLVLVRAPAGFGKSTAMAQSRQRLAATGMATAWLSLDRADNDVSRFLHCLGEAALRLGIDEPLAGAPFDAVAALAAHDAPFTLFLDDLERVHAPGVLGLLREVINQLPRGGRIVIGSRSLPDLGLGRLRARGQLLEIDTDRLRFSLEETSVFFSQRSASRTDHSGDQSSDLRSHQLSEPRVPADMLAQLHRKTEGWVAAISLASMALQRHGLATGFVARFSGCDSAVADYLAEDVLAHQPREIRDFLLRTSILRQLDASVCQALNPHLDCAAILDRLAASNLFITPVTGAAPAWRYHSLFADFLRAQLAREQPDELARLHLAASGWYESHGRPVPAIDHAIEGGDPPHALTLLDSCAQQFLEDGRMRMLSRWFAAIPAHQLRAHPVLQLIALWAACFTHGPSVAMAALAQSGCADSPVAEVRASAHALRPLLLAMQDRFDEAYAAGRESLARLPTGLAFVDSALRNAMANILAVVGDPHESQRLLDTARSQQGNSHFNRMYTESLEGMLDLQGGRLRLATARFRMAVESTHAGPATAQLGHHSHPRHSHGNAWAGVLYAGVAYELNQLLQASHLLNVYLPLARDVGLPDHMILSHVMRSRIAFHAGDIDAAFQALTELEYLGHDRQLPRVVAAAKLERSRILLLQGNGPAARDELVRADVAGLWERERRQRLPAHDLDYLALAQARWQIHFGDPRQALTTLGAELHAAIGAGRLRRALKLRLLRALALQRAGDTALAIDDIGAVLRSASQEGFVRLIVDEGPAIATLLQRFSAALESSGSGRIDPLLAAYLQSLRQALGPEGAMNAAPNGAIDGDAAKPGSGAAQSAGGGGGLGGIEPLTRKEIRVVQLLAEGYSNSAMAEKLFVSDSTVRTHLRNINMKLYAKSRTQAVAIARRIGVIR